MKKKGNGSRVFLWFALITTCLIAILNAFVAIVLMYNLWGVADIFGKLMISYGYATSMDISYYVFSLILQVLVEFYFASFYAKAIKYRANSPLFARRLMGKGVWQLFIGSFVPAIFAIISASIMGKYKQPTIPAESVNKNDLISAYKLEAMTEAVERLKELKAKGAISEEEYYINLNRILEG